MGFTSCKHKMSTKGSTSAAACACFAFLLALSCASGGQSVVAAHPNSGAACSDSDNVPLLSYHVHVLFWPFNKDSTAAAMKLQADFIDAFGE